MVMYLLLIQRKFKNLKSSTAARVVESTDKYGATFGRTFYVNLPSASLLLHYNIKHNHRDSQNFSVVILQTPEIIFDCFGYKFMHKQYFITVSLKPRKDNYFTNVPFAN
jgi:hypothetical protein